MTIVYLPTTKVKFVAPLKIANTNSTTEIVFK